MGWKDFWRSIFIYLKAPAFSQNVNKKLHINTVHEVRVFYEDHKIWPNVPFGLEIHFLNVKFMWKIKSNFVAFLENPNFMNTL